MADILSVYHGSDKVIETPKYGVGKRYNDYGLGFYTTQDKDLAGEWAVLTTWKDGYINAYQLDTTGLSTLYLDEMPVEHWVAILMDHREGRYADEIYADIAKYKEKYLIDISAYDVISGWRADDSYFQYVESFAADRLSLENLQQAMRFGDLGQQICVKSETAFGRIAFVAAHQAEMKTYYQAAMDRDEKARADFRAMLRSGEAREGTLMRDLL